MHGLSWSSIYMTAASSFGHQYRSRADALQNWYYGSWQFGDFLQVQGHSLGSYWLGLFSSIFAWYWYVMVYSVKAGDGAIPKREPEPDSVSALTRFDHAGGLSPAILSLHYGVRTTMQCAEALLMLYFKPSAPLKRCARHILTC